MIDKALLAKIRKCLALSQSANEHEAAAALSKARELMNEHDVTDEDLRMADIEEAVARASRTVRPPLWESYLDAAVCRALGVCSYLNEVGDRAYIGRGAAPDIASYAFIVLYRQLKRARRSYIHSRLRRCRPSRKRLRADIFCEGWAGAIYSKIAAIAPERKTDPELDQYLVKMHPGLVEIGSRGAKVSDGASQNDYWNGRTAGRGVHLHSGVSGQAAPEALPCAS